MKWCSKTIDILMKKLSKKALLAVLGFTFAFQMNAQKEIPKNRPYADLSKYHFGFYIGTDLQDMKIQNAGFVDDKGTPMFAEIGRLSPGFVVGVIFDLNLMRDLNLRLLPSLHFADKTFTYSNGNEEIKRFTQRTNLINFPVMFKYSSRRLNNIRPYVIGGGYGAMYIGQKNQALLKFNTLDFGVSLGMGCDIYLPFFKLCPELTFSWGFVNNHKTDRPDLKDSPDIIYTQTIKKSTTKMITLSFNFE